MQWERQTGHSESSHLELMKDGVLTFQDEDRTRSTRWTFDQVLAGELDGHVGNLFGGHALDEIKEAARKALRRRPAPGA